MFIKKEHIQKRGSRQIYVNCIRPKKLYTCLWLYTGSKKLRSVGRVFLIFLYHYRFSIQRAYGKLKQNLVKF